MNTNNYGGRGPLQRFLQKYAVSNLSLVIIMCYGFGYLLQYVNASFLNYLTLNPYAICHGQIWRLVTWVLVPPDTSNILFIIIAMMFYYSIGTSLERVWGTYAYNVYIWLGIGITIIGAFVVMAVSYILAGTAGISLTGESAAAYFAAISRYFSTYYVNMSIFLACASIMPDYQLLLYGIIPIKMKWLAILDVVLLAVDAVQGGLIIRIVIIASLLNFIIFFFCNRNLRGHSPKQAARRKKFQKQISRPQNQYAGGAKHRCAVCGRTELDDPTLEFRYCSKCNGNYEYCQDHLFTHEHVK